MKGLSVYSKKNVSRYDMVALERYIVLIKKKKKGSDLYSTNASVI